MIKEKKLIVKTVNKKGVRKMKKWFKVFVVGSILAAGSAAIMFFVKKCNRDVM